MENTPLLGSKSGIFWRKTPEVGSKSRKRRELDPISGVEYLLDEASQKIYATLDVKKIT